MAIKRYLGDGVYADVSGFRLVLTTENGLEVTNTIYLEPEVLAAMDAYLKDMRQLVKESQKGVND